MTEEYVLEQRIIGPRVQLSISKKRYEQLSHARQVLSEALAFEQRYELLLGNFISMEIALTEASLRGVIEPRHEYADLAGTLEKANRHVVNLLTTMRGYADQVVQDFKCLSPEVELGLAAKVELSRAYDRSPDYRFICALRNHVQHKAVAIHSFDGNSDRGCDANSWVEAIRFYVDKNLLQADRGFKHQVLMEQPDKIDIRHVARRGVYEVGAVHVVLRKMCQDHVHRARQSIESAIREYRDAGAESTLGLGARLVGNTSADVPLLLNWDDVRLQLVVKNRVPPNLWPRANHRAPKPADITSLREELKQTRAQAAALVFVSEESWAAYEDGLPMPEGLYQLYRLQVGRHPTHQLERRDDGQGAADLQKSAPPAPTAA